MWLAGCVGPSNWMKIGRNSLCPCGSEMKYKRCCLATSRQATILEKAQLEIAEAQLRQAEDRSQSTRPHLGS